MKFKEGDLAYLGGHVGNPNYVLKIGKPKLNSWDPMKGYADPPIYYVTCVTTGEKGECDEEDLVELNALEKLARSI